MTSNNAAPPPLQHINCSPAPLHPSVLLSIFAPRYLLLPSSLTLRRSRVFSAAAWEDALTAAHRTRFDVPNSRVEDNKQML